MSTPVPRPDHVFDRDSEWRRLERLWSSARPELVVVLGRRRVGKSHLLAPFCETTGGIYYQATRRTVREQLRALTRQLGEHYDDAALRHGEPFPDWEALFAYLVERAGDVPTMLVLDEFPYLDDVDPAFPSVIQRLWDHELGDTRIKLVLCGSHITHMRNLEAADQPLYARRTARLDLRPFHFRDVVHFVPEYAHREVLTTYGVFGGMPGHLAMLDSSQSLADNIVEHVLTPGARLHDEAQHMLDAFLSQAHVHYSILEAIASGQHTWSGITSRLGKGSGSLSRPLRWLIDMELVERVVPITAKNPRRSKQTLYRLADPHVRFWHRLVAPLVQSGTLHHSDLHDVYSARIAPRLDELMGAIFEDVCRMWMRTTERFDVLRVGEWWTPDAQVDVVAIASDQRLYVGECKWGTIGRADLQKLRRRARKLESVLEPRGPITYLLFSGEAPDSSLDSALDEHVVHIGLDALFAER